MLLGTDLQLAKYSSREIRFMKIEYLFPEITGIFGDHANIDILERSVPNAEVISTSLNSEPRFISEEIDLVYMGSMTELSQKIVIERLNKYKNKIIEKIEDGQNFLITGNALEIFGNGIKDVGKFVFEENGGPFLEGLGIFNFDTERDMINKYNSLWLGEYEGEKLTGLRSQFTRSFYREDIAPLFKVLRGPGLNEDISIEGIKYKGFRGTYTLGPLFIMNPNYLEKVLGELGVEEYSIPFRDSIFLAHDERVKEYSNPDTGYLY